MMVKEDSNINVEAKWSFSFYDGNDNDMVNTMSDRPAIVVVNRSVWLSEGFFEASEEFDEICSEEFQVEDTVEACYEPDPGVKFETVLNKMRNDSRFEEDLTMNKNF